jgi:hypothetical protein
MHRSTLLAVVAAAAAGVAFAQQGGYTPGAHNVVLPPDWAAQFVRYATVDKPDRRIIRNMYINPEAFAALRAGQSLPYGSVVVMADQRARLDAQGATLQDAAGRLVPEPPFVAIAVQQKERGWGEGYGPELRNGEWEYARFDPATGQRMAGPLNACFTCHLQHRAQQDYTFTTWDYANRAR